MMGAMNSISSGYTDIDSLTNPKLYDSDAVKQQVSEYINAVNMVAGMDDAAISNMLNSVGEGTVVIMIMPDGSITVTPNLG
jgi:hypothetical protein